MENPCFIVSGGLWGFDLDWIIKEAAGRPISIYDCPPDYRPECEDDWPALAWFVCEVR